VLQQAGSWVVQPASCWTGREVLDHALAGDLAGLAGRPAPGGPCVRQRGQAGKAGTAAVREPSTSAGQGGRHAAALGRRQRPAAAHFGDGCGGGGSVTRGPDATLARRRERLRVAASGSSLHQ
jgi:hypothetical protein